MSSSERSATAFTFVKFGLVGPVATLLKLPDNLAQQELPSLRPPESL